MSANTKYGDLKLALAVGAVTLTFGITLALASREQATVAPPQRDTGVAVSTTAGTPAKAPAPAVTRKSRGS